MLTENRWCKGIQRASEQLLNSVGPILSVPIDFVGSSALRAWRTSTSEKEILLRVGRVAA